MKKFTKLLFAVAALFAFACTTDATKDLAVDLGKVEGQTTLTLSLEESRTQLGEAVAGLYPVTWSEGDKISVNGVESSSIVISENAAVATFTFNEVLEYPYAIAYPAAAAGKVVFADQQPQSEGTFANGAAAMYGYKSAEGGLALNHLTGVLKIGVVGTGAINFVQISTVDRAPIAGEFAIDFATGELTPTSASKYQISAAFEESADGDAGLALSSEPKYLHFTVPAGVYNELYVTLYDADGGVMYATVKADDTKPLVAGKVREFSNTIPYAPNASVFVIRDKETLKAFGEQAATLDKDAIFVADVDMTGETWTPIEGYAKTVLGNGYSIKGLTAPLFGTTSASIKGLHLRDVVLKSNEAPVMGALACTVTASNEATPTIEHCSASGTLTVDNQTLVPQGDNSSNELVYAGLVARAIGASLNHCENKVVVTVDHLTVTDDDKSVYPFIAGVAAYVAEFTNSSSEKIYTNVTNCTNSAAVTYQDQSMTALPTARAVYMGGVISRCGDNNHAIISNNTNDAPITIQNAYVEHSNRPMIGGIAARTGHLMAFTNNKNTAKGKITITGNIRKMYTGGVFGYMADAVATFNEAPCTLTDCANYADVEIVCPDLWAVAIGGLGGQLTYFNMTNCHNYGKSILVKTTATSAKGDYNIAGFIGQTTGDKATLRMKIFDCTNNAALTTEWTDATVSVMRIAGLTAYSHSSWNNSYNNKDAKITVKGKITSTAANSLFDDTSSDTQVTIGGIGGYLASTGSYDCNNYADVEVDATWITTKGSFIQIGGITGRTHNKIWRGVNYGDIYLKGDTSGVISVTSGDKTYKGRVFLGGAAGLTYYDCADLHNEGNIYVSGNHNYLDIGGVTGGSSGEAKNFTNKGSVNVDATYNQAANIAGVVGLAYYNGKSDILDCHNYGKINVLGDAKAGMHVSGVATEVDGSHNKQVYNHKGADIYINLTSSTTTLHVGGCQYRSKDPLTDAVNEGNITVEGKVGGTLYIGGVLCLQNGYARTNLTNKGKITVGADITGSCFVGGVCYDGQYDKTWLNCHNEGDIEFTKSFTNTGNVRCGGLLGKFENDANYGIFDGCSNSGNITFNGRTNSYLRLGGMIGCLRGGAVVIIHNGFTNSGNITFNGETPTKNNVHIGGIIGCASIKYAFTRSVSSTTTDESGTETTVTTDQTWTGNIVNTGTISVTGKSTGSILRAGGLFGLLDQPNLSPFHNTAKYYQLGDVINAGDVGTDGSIEAGGVVPTTAVAVEGVEVFCNVKAVGSTKAGMIFSIAPTTTVVAKNCKVGGTFCNSVTTNTEEDPDGNSITTTTENIITLDASNWYTTLFGGTTAWSESAYEGCSLLTEKPTI